jgi:hypothetical protein
VIEALHVHNIGMLAAILLVESRHVSFGRVVFSKGPLDLPALFLNLVFVLLEPQ